MPRLCTPIRAFIPFVCSLYKRNKKTKLGLEIPDQNVLWRCSYSPASFFSFSLVYLRNRTPWVICAPVFVKWQAKRSKFLGCTCNNWNHIMKTVHYLTKKNYKSMLPSRQNAWTPLNTDWELMNQSNDYYIYNFYILWCYKIVTKSHFSTNHCWIFLCISKSCKWNSPVGNWSPEMSTDKIRKECDGLKITFPD